MGPIRAGLIAALMGQLMASGYVLYGEAGANYDRTDALALRAFLAALFLDVLGAGRNSRSAPSPCSAPPWQWPAGGPSWGQTSAPGTVRF
jgi:hypothetical protein